MEREVFLKKYRMTEEDIAAAGCTWGDLLKIYHHYRSSIEDRTAASELIARLLRRESRVHSVRMRLKDAEHLIEKVIRKRKKNNERRITVDNYDTEITDLIGLRILHIYKDDWMSIHEHILAKFSLIEIPKAYIREGDPLEHFAKVGCEVAIHEAGYRSIHYIVEQYIGRVACRAEIQVRTLFEEGWSEVDHHVRYPYFTEDKLVNAYLLMFNRLAGSADEMGSFIKDLCLTLKAERERYKALSVENSSIEDERQRIKDQMDNLRQTIEKLGKQVKERDVALSQIDALRSSYDINITKSILFPTGFYDEIMRMDAMKAALDRVMPHKSFVHSYLDAQKVAKAIASAQAVPPDDASIRAYQDAQKVAKAITLVATPTSAEVLGELPNDDLKKEDP